MALTQHGPPRDGDGPGLGNNLAGGETEASLPHQRTSAQDRRSPAAPELRPYQTDVIARLGAVIAAGHRRPLLVAPTGSGKTGIIAAVIAEAVEKGRRVLVIAHRREIVAQTVAKLYAAGVDAGVVQAGFPP